MIPNSSRFFSNFFEYSVKIQLKSSKEASNKKAGFFIPQSKKKY